MGKQLFINGQLNLKTLQSAIKYFLQNLLHLRLIMVYKIDFWF